MKPKIKEWAKKRKDSIKMVAVSVGTGLVVGTILVLKEKYDMQRIDTGLYKAIELGYMSLHDPSTGEAVNSDEWVELITNRKK